jgi:hypothetical protein
MPRKIQAARIVWFPGLASTQVLMSTHVCVVVLVEEGAEEEEEEEIGCLGSAFVSRGSRVAGHLVIEIQITRYNFPMFKLQ